MTDAELARLEQAASRNDYASMVALARALYDTGRNERAVVRTCYGVALPDEFFAIGEARAQDRLPPMLFTNQPWNLAVPPARGGPAPDANVMDRREQEALALVPQLLPLLILSDPYSRHGDSLLCYHLDELAAGRPTILGIPLAIDNERGPTRFGDSLISVMLEHFADRATTVEKAYHHPYNRGAGSVDRDEVESAHKRLEKIEAIARVLHALP